MRIAVKSFSGQVVSPLIDGPLNNVKVLALGLPEFIP